MSTPPLPPWRQLPGTTGAAVTGQHRALGQLLSQVSDIEGQVNDQATAAAVLDSKVSTLKGLYLGRQILTGAGTCTLPPGTKRVRIMATGAGGNGGDAAPGTGVGAAAGGSSGVLIDFEIVSTDGQDLTAGSFSCGVPHAVGGTSGANGGNGGDTTFTLGGVLYTAKGGAGGSGMVGLTGAGNVNPLAPPAGSSSGPGILVTWGNGEPGIVIPGTAWFSGNGGSTDLGTGGVLIGGTANGNPGQNYGGGGSGAAAASAAKPGGQGAPGAVILYQFS